MTISTGAAPAVEHAAPRPRLLKRQISEAQREAARRNGAKSRGPATARGKAESSGNARKHGLYARLHLLTPEETQALRLHIQGYLDSPQARNPASSALTSAEEIDVAGGFRHLQGTSVNLVPASNIGTPERVRREDRRLRLSTLDRMSRRNSQRVLLGGLPATGIPRQPLGIQASRKRRAPLMPS